MPRCRLKCTSSLSVADHAVGLLFELHHPVMMDNDKAYWRALRNKYWPAYYIVDKKGNIRFKSAGFGGDNEELVNELSMMIEMAIEASTEEKTMP